MAAYRKYRDRNFAFGTQVLTLRTRAGLTQTALGEQVGVHIRSIQNWEAGESYPKAETLQRLITVFLNCEVFSRGQERTEAEALWSLASTHGTQTLPPFDTGWFEHILALQYPLAMPAALSVRIPELSVEVGMLPSTGMSHAITGWSDAIEASPLYGRERELATLYQWVVEEHCRVITIIGPGGMGKSLLAVHAVDTVVSQFDVVVFHSLHNGPPLAEILDQTIRAVSDQPSTPVDQGTDKIGLLMQLFREHRCLLILDHFDAILQPNVLMGGYRTGYADYGTLVSRLSVRDHQSCLLLTTRKQPAELGLLEGRTKPVRSLLLTGLQDHVCDIILKQRGIIGTQEQTQQLARQYDGNPLALHLVSGLVREASGGDLYAFLASKSASFDSLDQLIEQQYIQMTSLEQDIMHWLAIDREMLSIEALQTHTADVASAGELLIALEALYRRQQAQRASDQSGFILQPLILEFVTNQIVEIIAEEVIAGKPRLLQSYVLVQATAKEHIRLTQEQQIATPLLQRIISACGSIEAAEQQLVGLLMCWRNRPLAAQGYGPGNIVNLLRVQRGHLRDLDLTHLLLRQAYLQGVDAHDPQLVGSTLQDVVFAERLMQMWRGW